MPDSPGFSDFERSVLAAVLANRAIGDDSRPPEDETERIVRGALISELVGGAHGPTRRVSIHGAVIEGDVDLGYLEWRGDLDLRHCRITGTLNINHMLLRGRLQLDGVDVERIEAGYAVVDGPFSLRHGCCRKGFPALAPLDLRDSTIRGPRTTEQRRPGLCHRRGARRGPY